jgi:hypothetical protein
MAGGSEVRGPPAVRSWLASARSHTMKEEGSHGGAENTESRSPRLRGSA